MTDKAPKNSLPTWQECALKIHNDEYESDGLISGEEDVRPTCLERFIHEYDDSDPYKSEWFMHRLEMTILEAKANGVRQAAGAISARHGGAKIREVKYLMSYANKMERGEV